MEIYFHFLSSLSAKSSLINHPIERLLQFMSVTDPSSSSEGGCTIFEVECVMYIMEFVYYYLITKDRSRVPNSLVISSGVIFARYMKPLILKPRDSHLLNFNSSGSDASKELTNKQTGG